MYACLLFSIAEKSFRRLLHRGRNRTSGAEKRCRSRKKRTGKANNDTGNPAKNVKHFTILERRSPCQCGICRESGIRGRKNWITCANSIHVNQPHPMKKSENRHLHAFMLKLVHRRGTMLLKQQKARSLGICNWKSVKKTSAEGQKSEFRVYN